MPPPPERRILLLTAAALLAVALVAYLRPLLLGETFVLRDHVTFTLPSRDHLARALAAGHLPEWWDGIGLGVPFAANPNYGVTYPPAWLVGLLPMPWAADFVLILHIAFAGFGASLLARRLGASPLGAAFAGAVLMTSGYVTSMMVNGIAALTLAWTPWIAWAADRAGAAEGGRGRARASLLVAALMAMQILSGDPAGVVTSGLLAALLTLTRARRRLVSLAALAAAFAGAVLLGAAGTLPAWELLGESERAGGIPLESAGIWSMHPWRLLEWIWPGALGDPTEPARNAARALADSSGGLLPPSWSLSVYVGAPVLLLAGAAAATRQPGARALLALTLLFALLALGTYTPFYEAYRTVVPLERLIRYPEKHLAGALVVWAALAGVGLTQLSQRPRPMLSAAAGVALVLGALVGAAAVGREELARWLAVHAQASGVSIAADGAVSDALSGGVSAVLVTALFAGALMLRPFPRFERAAPWLAAGIIIAHLVAMGWGLQRLAPREEVVREPAILAGVIPAGGPRPRVYRPNQTSPPAAGRAIVEHTLAQQRTAIENTAAAHGFAHVPGYDPAHTARLHALWDHAARSSSGERPLDLFDVEHAILSASVAARSRLPVVATAGRDPVARVRNAERRSRAFVAPRWRWIADEAELRRALLEGPFDPGAVLLAGAGAPGSDTAPPKPCEVMTPRPEHVDVRCRSPRGGYAVLLDAWSPGWTATVDGAPARIERADGVVRAVRVPPGEHTIAFRYRTPGLRTGAAVSAVSWFALVALALWLRRRRAKEIVSASVAQILR